ncbi:DUF881 domain-containing protein [Cellulomonas pakistanensis]|uniref:DUF881 domain-containing protein n=1 Tax=Cellulomonas pakistanensis TaxID=992287 RepID=A0A919P661_9CELL|nr:DUF881 domain-containing protein [Cellulomonas pakistanensis]GIG34980.1 hypothetical protein Cpa01nite_03610 [Cellulomonas pakistanensis]
MTEPSGSARPGRAPAWRRPDASMSLLTEVTQHPLDPEYQDAAERRARAGTPRRRGGRGTVAVAALAVVLGAATTWSVLALRAPQPSALAAREVLADQITERSAELERLRDRSAALSDEIADLQEQGLSAVDSPLLDRLAVDSIASGATAVTGDGLRITLQDADTGTDQDDPDGRVRDSDLQLVVNGLWASGAEAIAVNGQRLGPTTAIRTAGDAILVDVVPLVGPYAVEAIGDPQGMQTALTRTSGGQLLAVLQSTYGIPTQVSSQRELHLPAAGTVTLRSAELPEGVPVLPDAGTTGPAATGESSGTLSGDDVSEGD